MDAKDKKKHSVILATDLTAAFDVVSHPLLLVKLNHIGFRGMSGRILASYLEDRYSYVEVQGFFSSLIKMPRLSVIQGSRLSGTFFTIYTLDVPKVNQIMKEPRLYKMLTGKELATSVDIEQESVAYVDDVHHVISGKSWEQIKKYINQLHMATIGFYNHNQLKINSSKTTFLEVKQKTKEDDKKILSSFMMRMAVKFS